MALDALADPSIGATPHAAAAVASLALLEGFDETRRVAVGVMTRVERRVLGAPTPGDLTLARWLPWRRARIERRHPRYDAAAIMQRAALGAIERLTLRGELAEAEDAVTTEYDWHLYAATRAFGGDVAGALAVLARESFPRSRRHTVEVVCCIEAFRRGDRSLSESLLDSLARADVWTTLHLAAGLLGRRPWYAYPYDDF
jgi:hypothetical protein